MKKLFATFLVIIESLSLNAQINHYDVNGDHVVNMVDVIYLINRILGKSNAGDFDKAYLTCPDNHHPHMIDLGLPSGTKWACCDIGASKPGEEGQRFAWGETKTKKKFEWDNYKYCDGTEETCRYIGSDISGTKYDVAHVKLGGAWKMPTLEQLDELCQYYDERYQRFKGPNGK